MMRQGYRDHLANVHLDQDPRDLRQHGEQTLFSFRDQGTSEDSEGVRNKNNENEGILLLVILVKIFFIGIFFISGQYLVRKPISQGHFRICAPLRRHIWPLATHTREEKNFFFAGSVGQYFPELAI